jgi:hypothetical protein
MCDAFVVSSDKERPEGVCGADKSQVVAASGHLRGEAEIYLSASTAATSLRARR